MQYLILGASGFIGSRIYDHLSKDITDYPSMNKVWGTFHYKKRHFLVPYDIHHDSFATLVSRTDLNLAEPFCVINTAFSGNLELCAQYRERTRHLNIDRTCEFAKEVHEAGGEYVYFSSSYVFPGNKEAAYLESDQVKPICEFGFQKAAVEEFLTEHISCNLILRLGEVVDGSPVNDHQLSHWFRMIKSGRTISIPQNRHFSLSCVETISTTVNKLRKKLLTGTWHISTIPGKLSANDIIQKLASRIGLPAHLDIQPDQYQPQLESRPTNTAIDCSQLVSELESGLTSDVDEVLDHFIYQANHISSLMYKYFGERIYYTDNPEILIIEKENEPHSLRRHPEF